MILYKLTYPTKEKFDEFIELLDKELNYSILMQRYFTIPAVLDEEGNVLEEATQDSSYSVDIYAEETDVFDAYLIKKKLKYKHNIMGYEGETKTL